jgi:hypothetical protein
MRADYSALIRGWIVLLLATGMALGQSIGGPRNIAPAVAAPAAPTITILTSATGVLVRMRGSGNASVDLGRVSFFQGTSAPGEAVQRISKSFVISTRFALQIDCPGSFPSSSVNVTMSRSNTDATDAITIDGTILGPAPQFLVQSMRCGSISQHRLEVEVPVSTPAGSLGTFVAFVATLNR